MANISQKQDKILGVKIDSTQKVKVLRVVRDKISSGTKFFIATPNPEIIIKAQDDRELRDILNSADISLPDGIGLAQAKKYLELPNPKDLIRRTLTLFVQGLGVGFLTIFDKKKITASLEIINGRDLFMDLIKLANKKGWRVYFLGGERGEGDGAKKELEKSYKKIKIKVLPGPMLNEEGKPSGKYGTKKDMEAVSSINKFNPHLLFVAFGAPKQEKWVYRWLKKLKIGGVMVVGGTFNYVSGKTKLPPSWIENAGLEWIWRLFTGNQKPERIFTAFPSFPLRIFWHKLTSESS